MGKLLVRNVDELVIKALKKRAGELGVSAESEHRRILEAALLMPQKRSFTDILKSIPAVGLDSDFERIQDDEDNHVFD